MNHPTLGLHPTLREGMQARKSHTAQSQPADQEFGLYFGGVLAAGPAGPRGEKMAWGFTGTDSQDLATSLNPFRATFVDLGRNRLSKT